MERIERSGGLGDAGPKTETVFIFDIFGALHEVVCDRRAERGPGDRRADASGDGDASSASPGVIRRWLAGIALALAGIGLTADPSAALGFVEPTVAQTVFKALF